MMGSKSIQGRAGFDAIFGDASAGVREIGAVLRAAVLAADPDAAEVAYPGYKTVNYGPGGAGMSSAYCYIMPLQKRVNFGFFSGTALRDPHGMLEGTGKTLRHVKVASTALARDTQLTALLAQAVEFGRASVGARN